jgi:hypothetical protein
MTTVNMLEAKIRSGTGMRLVLDTHIAIWA